MVNLNGECTSESHVLNADNRAFLLGDGVFETMKMVNGRILYFEDHYFRLMSAMRIVRMEIPMDFTMEVLENHILTTAAVNECLQSARIRFTVFRNPGGRYLPSTNNISFLITADPAEQYYPVSNDDCEVELFKDFYVPRHLLSTLKTTNRMLNITASVFANENGYQNCLLLNDGKNVVEAINGNLFMRMGDTVITPPVSEGCINGVMRKQIVEIGKKMDNFSFSEAAISPFDLQKADELFISNVMVGVQSVTRYRKKDYSSVLQNEIQANLNKAIEFN